jgi:hypothetical protein
MQNLSLKDLVDAFSGAKDVARDAMPTRADVLRALGGKPADDMMSSFGIFAAGIVLGAGLAVLFAPRPGSEIREAIGEKIGEKISTLRTAADA